MKKYILMSHSIGLTFILALFTSSCISSQSFRPVKGSGEPVNRTFKVSDFHAIEVSGGFDVNLVQGNTEEVVLTAQENLYDYITVAVEQGILKIYTEANIMSTRALKARIAFRSMDKLRVSGGGDVHAETPIDVPVLDITLSGGGDLTSVINTNELRCHISGGGDARLDGKIKSYDVDLTGGGDLKSVLNSAIIRCRISGGGDVEVRNSETADKATFDVTGGGDVEADLQVERMKCTVSGGGDVTLKGKAMEFTLSISGGGDVNALDFPVKTASVQASGGSDVRINVSDQLTGYIHGGGNVYYSGNPEHIAVDTRGGSEIRRQH